MALNRHRCRKQDSLLWSFLPTHANRSLPADVNNLGVKWFETRSNLEKFLRYWKGGQAVTCREKAPGRSPPLTALGSVRHPGTGRLASLVFRGPARLARGTLAALLASLWCLRRPGWIERPAPFFPTRLGCVSGRRRWLAELATWVGLEGAACSTTAADASTERAVSSRAERAKASESQPAQRSEQDCLARRRAKRAARYPRAKRADGSEASGANLARPPSRAGGGFPHVRVLQFLPRCTRASRHHGNLRLSDDPVASALILM